MNVWRSDEYDAEWFPRGVTVLPNLTLPLIGAAIFVTATLILAVALRLGRRV
jgi:hypothetical protein